MGRHTCFPGKCFDHLGEAKAACKCDAGFKLGNPVSKYECQSKCEEAIHLIYLMSVNFISESFKPFNCILAHVCIVMHIYLFISLLA